MGNTNPHARRRFRENVKTRESGQRHPAWCEGSSSHADKSEGPVMGYCSFLEKVLSPDCKALRTLGKQKKVNGTKKR